MDVGVQKKNVCFVLLCILFCATLSLGFIESNAVSRFSRITLRYGTPLTGQVAFRARQHAAENRDGFWPTFWHEANLAISNGRNTAYVNSIMYSGDAFLVWPAEYIIGSAPSPVDDLGIAVSDSLAHRLWGSENIVGMGVYVNDEPRVVRGVFRSPRELALVSFHIEDTSQYFSAVELSGGAASPTRSDAESFAVSSGLGSPDLILMGGVRAVSFFMSLLPLLIPLVYALVLILRHIRKHYPLAVTPLFFGGFILFAIILPVILNSLPPWLIPTRWSDFGFWGIQLENANDALREFLSMNPSMRDVELRIHLLRQAGFMLVATCAGCFICCFFKRQDSVLPK